MWSRGHYPARGSRRSDEQRADFRAEVPAPVEGNGASFETDFCACLSILSSSKVKKPQTSLI
jgi:hypothetical protein